jgi:hypothetical protein
MMVPALFDNGAEPLKPIINRRFMMIFAIYDI